MRRILFGLVALAAPFAGACGGDSEPASGTVVEVSTTSTTSELDAFQAARENGWQTFQADGLRKGLTESLGEERAECVLRKIMAEFKPDDILNNTLGARDLAIREARAAC